MQRITHANKLNLLCKMLNDHVSIANTLHNEFLKEIFTIFN